MAKLLVLKLTPLRFRQLGSGRGCGCALQLV